MGGKTSYAYIDASGKVVAKVSACDVGSDMLELLFEMDAEEMRLARRDSYRRVIRYGMAEELPGVRAAASPEDIVIAREERDEARKRAEGLLAALGEDGARAAWMRARGATFAKMAEAFGICESAMRKRARKGAEKARSYMEAWKGESVC
jgi:hypothetical protein